MQAFCEASSGAMGGLLSTTATYPVDVVKTKMQTSDGKDYKTAFDCVRFVLKQPGGAATLFYNGLPIKLVWSAVGKFVFYGSFKFLVGLYSRFFNGAAPTFGASLVLSYLAELLTVPASLPFEALATRMQTSKGLSLPGAFAQVLKESGIAGFYKGIKAYLFLAFQTTIVNTVFTKLKEAFVKGRAKNVLSMPENFVLGAFSRSVGLITVFPLIRVVKWMQAGKGEGKSISQVLSDISSGPDGYGALYRGLGPELLRGVLSTGLVLSVKEQVYAANHRMLLSLGAGQSLQQA
jgi:hypothetical protein